MAWLCSGTFHPFHVHTKVEGAAAKTPKMTYQANLLGIPCAYMSVPAGAAIEWESQSLNDMQ